MLQYVDQVAAKYFDGYAFRDWLAANSDIALYVAAIYLAGALKGPSIISHFFNTPYGSGVPKDKVHIVKKMWVVWNLGLSVFSLWGTTRVVPVLINSLRTRTLHDTLCTFREEEFYTNEVGVALGLFTISKLPEFGDTFFLLLKGVKLPFLQWFHHTSMFLFVWNAYQFGSSTFIVAASMNFAVHTIMYFYFAMAEAGFKDTVRPFAMYITMMQLVQMAGVIFASCYVIYYKYADAAAGIADGAPGSCAGTSMFNARLQLIIYSFFMYLFGKMFVNAYIRTPQPKTVKTA